MSYVLLTDAYGNTLKRLENVNFSQAAYDQLAQGLLPPCMLPCKLEILEGGVALSHTLSGLERLDMRMKSCGPRDFMEMTRSLVEAVTAIKLCPGISLAGVPLDFADVCCNDQNEVRLMCSYQEPVMGDDALAGAHVLAQLRAQSRPELRTEETREMWLCIDDPFADLYALNNYFNLRAGQAGAQVRQENTVSRVQPISAPYQAAPVVPKGKEPGVIHAVRHALEVTPKAPAVAIGMDEPTRDEPTAAAPAAQPVQAQPVQSNGPKPVRSVAVGMDEPTLDGGFIAPGVSTAGIPLTPPVVGQPKPNIAIGMDAATMAPNSTTPAPGIAIGMDTATVAPNSVTPASGIAIGMDTATVAPDAAMPSHGIAMGMDDATVPPDTTTGQPAYGVAMGMDSPTAPPDTFQQTNAAPAPGIAIGMDEITGGFAEAPAKPAKVKKEKPPKPPKEPRPPKEPKPLKLRKERPAPVQRTYGEQKKYFWTCMIWLGAAIAVVIVLDIVAAAFLGAIGALVLTLGAALVGALLVNRGVIELPRYPKKQENAVPEPVRPDIDDVFPVHLKLRSINLGSMVEITIRQQTQLLGSDARQCLSPLKFKGISRRHCSIISEQGAGHMEYYIRDEGSKNGTKLNGEILQPGMRYPLHIGDRITLATQYVFEVGSDAY